MSRVRRVPFIFEVRDLWPGIFIELGVLKNRAVIWALERVEMFLYRSAARVVVVTESFAENLSRRGVPRSKITVVTNGVDSTAFSPRDTDHRLRRDFELDGKFVVLYIGAHGISHALGRILEAAEATADDREICWVFVGEGAEKTRLVETARAKGLQNVRFVQGQPREQVSDWYAACDVALVPLKNIPLFETFIPSKIFEIMACGRPIIGSVAGEARRILDASGAAIVVDPEDAQAIAAAARRLKTDQTLRRRLADAGRRFVTVHYDRRALSLKYIALLESVVHEPH